MNLRGMAILAALLATLVVGPLPAPTVEANPSTTITVLQLNLCHSGIAPCYTADRVLTKAMAVVSATQPQVLSVNEACSADVEPLREAMGASATLFVPAEHRDGAPVTCLDGQRYGNIVMTTSPPTGAPAATGRYTAQVTGDEMRVWGCLPTRTLTACTTHLTARSTATAMTQCAELMSRIPTVAPVIVTGDLNLRYPAVQDCTPTGFHRKGDGDVQHVLATTTLAFAGTTQISMSNTTDHPAWLVTLTTPIHR